jgi:hypothetical protein
MATTRFQYYIDGTLLETEPIGIEDFKVVIERDEENRFIGLKYPISLQFIGDGYDLIKSTLRTYGRNKSLTFEIRKTYGLEQGTKTVMVGSILLSEGLDNYYQKVWDTKIRDENYSKYIFNNKTQQIRLDLTKSVNGVTITPPIAFDLDVARPNLLTGVTPAYIGTGIIDCPTYDTFELLQYIIDYMTDATIQLSSSWYDALGYGIGAVPLSSLKENYDVDTISFDDLFLTIARLYNLWIGGDGSTLFLETEDWFNSRTSTVTFENQRTDHSYNPLFIYRNIKIGSERMNSLGNNFGSTAELSIRNQNSNSFFLNTELYSLSTLNSSEELDLTPKLTISPYEPSYSLLSRRNGQTQTVEGLESLTSIYSDLLDYDQTFIPSIDNHALITYDTSTNKQIIESLDPFNEGANGSYLNQRFKNSEVLDRYKLTSDYRFKSTNERFVYKGTSTESGKTIAGNSSGAGYRSISQLISAGGATQLGSLAIPSSLVGTQVTLKMRVMIPVYVSSSDWVKFGEPIDNNFFSEGDGVQNVTGDIPALELNLRIRCIDGATDKSDTLLISDAYSGKVYEHSITITVENEMDSSDLGFSTSINDTLGGGLTNDYYVDFIDCVIEKEEDSGVDVAKSSDAKATLLTFESDLSENEIDSLTQNPFSSIEVDGKTCYHNKTMISLVTGQAEFELLTDSDKFTDEYLT